jgi:hypothetical protein
MIFDVAWSGILADLGRMITLVIKRCTGDPKPFHL